MLSEALLYYRTIRRMKPSMIVSRLRGQRRVHEYQFAPAREMHVPAISISELDFDPMYLARFDVDSLQRNDFLLISERHVVDLHKWDVPEASHLWNFNLHYFEWGIALAVRYRETGDRRWFDCFKRFVSSWMDTCSYPQGDAWHPYTISLRLVNWLIAIDIFNREIQCDAAFFSKMIESMYRQYRHLLINQETHLRANHYWENVKTLVILSASFGEGEVLQRALKDLSDQLDEQILPDGVHFERSLMYHKLVLEGLLRVWRASRHLGFELPKNFQSKTKLMLDAMVSLERGMGKTPFFNDAADGVAKECRPLAAACCRLSGINADDSKTEFPFAGYYKLYDGDIAVLFDAGEPGPSYMLGHAHCDCLSYELSYRNEPLIVNSGTYAYQSELRSYFRSTAAHNTCLVDNEDQLECWGEHRVGRGYELVDVKYDGNTVSGTVSYSGLMLTRRISLRDGRIDVEDSFPSNRLARSVVHFAPNASFSIASDHVQIQWLNSCLLLESSYQMEEKQYLYSERFGSVFDAAREIVLMGQTGLISYCISIDERNVNNG